MTRYERRRNQKSRLWRKRHKRQKEHWKTVNIIRRNHKRFKGGPNVDTSLKQVPLMVRIVQSVYEALRARKNHQRQKR